MPEIAAPVQILPSARFFPLPQIREKQVKALDFFDRMVASGCRDIVIAAPTGSGKSSLGAAIAFWAAQPALKTAIPGDPGAYVLVTQLLLQDQIETDIQRYPANLNSGVSLKAAPAYGCSQFDNCGVGMKMKPPCINVRAKMCNYQCQKSDFLGAQMAVTNYPYLFTERTYVGKMEPRKVVVMDECHSVPDQILNFIDLTLSPSDIQKYAPSAGRMPSMEDILEFADWLKQAYFPVIKKRIEGFGVKSDMSKEAAKELEELTQHSGRMQNAAREANTDPDNWVFWQEDIDTDNGTQRKSIAKPIDSAPYFKRLVGDSGTIRVYMSAYPGAKEPFCRSLGLNPDETAMLSLGSTFPVEHRLFHYMGVGSMSRRCIDETMPAFLRAVEGIVNSHSDERGIVHSVTYNIGEKIYEYFKGKPAFKRLIFPRKASEREDAYARHCESKEPTIIVSPSFMEGFDFNEDKARWQIIAKVPYKSLGDKQTMAKMERDPEWYQMSAASSILQATGRVCRSETDHGVTYMLDADFKKFYGSNSYLFPKWFKDAINMNEE